MEADSDNIDLTNESDRGCILVAVALLEEALERRFRSVFGSKQIPKTVQDSLFVANGPLATFSAKIKIAYACGFIPKETFADLECIRQLRNKAAHMADDFDFSDDAVGRKVEALRCVEPLKPLYPRRYHLNSEQSVPASGEQSVNPGRDKAAAEAMARVGGYIKYRKALFAAGVTCLKLKVELGLGMATDSGDKI